MKRGSLIVLLRVCAAQLKGLDTDNLVISHIQVNKAQRQRRRTYRAHGRINRECRPSAPWQRLHAVTVAAPSSVVGMSLWGCEGRGGG